MPSENNAKQPMANSDLDTLRRRIVELEARQTEIDRIQAALRESEQAYRQLFEHSVDGILIAVEHHIIMANDALCTVLGLSREELLGKNPVDMIHPDYRDVARDRVKRMLQGESVSRSRMYRIARADGSYFWAEAHSKRIDWLGKTAYQTILRDVDERELRQENLRQTAQRLAYHVSNTPLGVIEADLDFHVTEWNQAAERIFGYTRKEAMGRSVDDLILSDAAHQHTTTLREALTRTGGGTRSTHQNVTRQGETLTCDWYYTPLIGSNGDVVGIGSLCQDVSDRVKAEAALRASESRFRSIIDTAPSVILCVSPDNRIEEFNPEAERLYGISREDAVGRNFLKLLVPEAAHEGVRADFRNVMDGQPLHGLETPIRVSDGPPRVFSWNVDRLTDAHGHPTGIIAIGHDITARKEAEEAQRRSHRMLNSTIDALDGTLVVLDRDLRIALCNWKGGEEAPGTRSQQPPFCYDTLKRRTDRCENCPAAETFRDGKPRVYEDHDPDTNTYTEVRINPILDDEGNVVNVIKYVQDVTQRKLAEEALRQSAQRYRALVRDAPMPIVIYCNEEIVFANPMAVEVLGGTSIEDLLSASIWKLVHPESHEAAKEYVASYKPGELIDICIRRLDGMLIDIEAAGTPIEFEGQPGMQVMFQDITHRKHVQQERERLEAQLRQAQKMEAVGQLAGGIAHDFNNILTAIIGSADVALRRVRAQDSTDKVLQTGLEQVESAANRAADLVRQLLAFSRQQESRPVMLNLAQSLRELERMLRRLIAEDIDFHVECAPDLRSLFMDPSQVEQVIVNLVINARDAMPTGGVLTVIAQNAEVTPAEATHRPDARPGPHVMLSVSDTGCGIDARTREHIFEPFFTTKAVGQGTGLGLSVVYGVIQQVGGHIQVSSEVDQGTTFEVYFPVSGEPPASTSTESRQSRPAAGSETVLVCEDDPGVRQLAVSILRDAGYTVLSAESASEAMGISEEHAGPIALLLSDVVMPSMHGQDLAQRLRSSRPALRTLFISGYDAAIVANHGVHASRTDFLEKPFSRQTLLAHVRAILDRVD